jgi:hypothetical protein
MSNYKMIRKTTEDTEFAQFAKANYSRVFVCNQVLLPYSPCNSAYSVVKILMI